MFLTGISQPPDNCYSIVRDELTRSQKNRQTGGQTDGRTPLIIAVSPHPESGMLYSRAKVRLGGSPEIQGYFAFISTAYKRRR